MRDIVTKYNMYAAWEYDKEEEALNEASQKGLQLVYGGCFHSKFRRDSSVRYIYQLDYYLGIEDMVRYKEIFADQGWEYINSTFNGWHYFRKPYQEGMDEREMHIYTDKESLREMQNRWLRVIIGLDILYALFAVLYMIHGFSGRIDVIAVEGVLFGVMALTFTLGIIRARKKLAGKKGGFVIPVQIILPIVILTLVGILAYKSMGLGYDVIHHEKFTIGRTDKETLPVTSSTFLIDKGGNYEISLDLHMEGGTVTFSLLEEDGTEVYSQTAENCRVRGKELKLPKGEYRTVYSYDYLKPISEVSDIKIDFKLRRD
jgi:hypothetical protein